MDLTPLMKPKSVGVVGASQRIGRATRVIVNLQKFGYAGQIFPINPKYDTILGLPCYPDLASTPEPATVQEQEPASATPSAFAWGNPSQTDADSRSNVTTDEQGERRPGESWVERAYRGPSPSNPSVSLRHRLSRAAFFDKREREAAAGLAQPVGANAGLPQASVGERELA